MTLTQSSGQVKVFDAAEGGNEITFNGTDNKFAAAGLPQDLWVQGHYQSFFMRDVTLTLTADGTTCEDKGKFTILFVVVLTDHAGSIEDDNAAESEYENTVVPPPDDTLGQHLFCYEKGAAEGRGSEFVGKVFPTNFEPSEFSNDPCALHLTRELMTGRNYVGPNGNENPLADPCGLEPSRPSDRDDDPQSGGSNGYIYDHDTPGFMVWGVEANTIIRKRTNWESWSEWLGTRCSTKKKWYTRQSYKKTGSFCQSTVTSATSNTLTDNTQSWGTNDWVPGVVAILSESGVHETRIVTSNDTDTITVADNWADDPNGLYYEVINTSAWTEINDVNDDNKSADGTTNITWDLN